MSSYGGEQSFVRAKAKRRARDGGEIGRIPFVRLVPGGMSSVKALTAHDARGHRAGGFMQSGRSRVWRWDVARDGGGCTRIVRASCGCAGFGNGARGDWEVVRAGEDEMLFSLLRGLQGRHKGAPSAGDGGGRARITAFGLECACHWLRRGEDMVRTKGSQRKDVCTVCARALGGGVCGAFTRSVRT